MKMQIVVASLFAGLLATAAIPTSIAAQDSHGHAHAGTAISHGNLTVAGFSVEVTTDEAIEPGVDAHLDVVFLDKKELPKAVRAWIGSEDASETGKSLLELEGSTNVHTHVGVPKPLLEGHRIWVEIENAGKKERASLPLPGAQAAPATNDHGHEHAFAATVSPAGEGRYSLVLKNAGGATLSAKDLQASGGPTVRVFLVDESLTELRHLVPAEGEAGTWTFAFAPSKPGNWRAYARAWAKGEESAETVLATIENPGTPAPVDTTPSTAETVDGFRFQLGWNPAPVVGHEGKFTVTVLDKDGKAAVLEPVAGALAHAFSLGENPEHTRVIAPEAKSSEGTPAATTVAGSVKHAGPGFRKLFVHVKVAGKEVVAPFGYTIGEGDADHGHEHDKEPGEGEGHHRAAEHTEADGHEHGADVHREH